MFDIGPGEFIALAILALVIFGDKLPSVAQQAGRTLRQLRQMANAAQADLQAGLGPEFKDFDPRDLNPKTFVRKHLLDGDSDPLGINEAYQDTPPYRAPVLGTDERPPFDNEAT